MPWKNKPRQTRLCCPFCKSRLVEYERSTVNGRVSYFECPNYDCNNSSGLCGTEEIWQCLTNILSNCPQNKKNML